MGQNPGDEKSQPSLELPSFPGLGRRKKRSRRQESSAIEHRDRTAPADAEDTSELTRSITATDTAESAEPRRKTKAEKPSPERRARVRRPELSGPLAAGLTGLLIGVTGGGATYGAMAGCEVVRGVSSCGGGPGFFLLVAILAALVLLGAGLLKLLGVAAAGSTSFLGVGIMTVVVMLVLLDVVYSPWMFVVVPGLGGASYLLAHWVTTRFDAATPQRPDWT
jgi:hypothetical protein